jgi:hypothetical protein
MNSAEKPCPEPEPDFDWQPAPLVSDAAVGRLVTLGYVALAVLTVVGLVGWGMYLDPAHAREILGGLATVAVLPFVVVFLMHIS